MSAASVVLTSERPHESDTLRTLVKLRWVAFLGQVLMITAVWVIWSASLPLVELSLLLTLLALSNVALSRRASLDAPPLELIGGVMLLDVWLLTGALALSGGPSNPFSVLYLVLVTLGAIMTTRRWTSMIAIASSIGFGLLFYQSYPLPSELGGHHGPHMEGSFSAHLQGMWLAYSIAAFSIGAFVSELSVTLRRQRERQDQTARLLGLAALAAGAAHEIGNPLGTIKITAEELEFELTEAEVAADLIEDARLINDEVERARNVLQRLAVAAGELTGEPLVPLQVRDLMLDVLSTLGAERERVSLEVPPHITAVRWPQQATTQVLIQLIRNALQAGSGVVTVHCAPERSGVRIYVSDKGVGMSASALAALGEPFFTTRPEIGMGLGVFVARSLVQRMGGVMSVTSTRDVGTRIDLWLPMELAPHTREQG